MRDVSASISVFIYFCLFQKWANFKPESRREHCIKELYDTESNYVEKALDMIINKFYTPLEGVLSPDDHKMIFTNIVVYLFDFVYEQCLLSAIVSSASVKLTVARHTYFS